VEAMTDPDFIGDVDRAIEIYEAFSGHAAARTRQMIDRHGAVGALSRLMVSADLQQGFKVLRDHDRLGESFEALVVRFEHLFKPDIVAAAEWRLKNPYELL